MKKKNVAEKVFKKIVEKTLVSDANRTSCAVIYQPKVPAKLEAFKKTKNDITYIIFSNQKVVGQKYCFAR